MAGERLRGSAGAGEAALLRALFETSPDVLLAVTTDSVVRMASRATHRVFGWQPEELIGQPLSLLIPPGQREEHAGFLANFQSTQRSPVVGTIREVEAVHRDGSAIPIDIHVGQASAGGRLMLTACIRDIRRRKQVELERQRYTAELEGEVAARTAELSARTAALEVALASAESAERARGEFLQNASHELRTPLVPIIGFGELIAEGQLTDAAELRVAAETVARNGREMLRRVDAILKLSQLASGCIALEEDVFVPTRVVEEVVALLKPRADSKGLTLTVEYSTTPVGALRGHSGHVREILFHLVSNALKFTERGWVRVRMTRSHLRLSIEVRDTGRGIDAERLRELFRPFSQVDGSASRRHGGIGVGLALCRGLAEVLGGRLEVESTPGLGSAFRLDLPISP